MAAIIFSTFQISPHIFGVGFNLLMHGVLSRSSEMKIVPS